ncbi:MAG: hypothetical protein ACNA8W_11340 [Bradymonadaceae bacterium]
MRTFPKPLSFDHRFNNDKGYRPSTNKYSLVSDVDFDSRISRFTRTLGTDVSITAGVEEPFGEVSLRQVITLSEQVDDPVLDPRFDYSAAPQTGSILK